MCHARSSGGDHLLGWGSDRQILAAIHNAVNFQTQATGNWKKKPPKLPTISRPSKPVKEKKKRTTVMDIFNKFSALSNK